MYVCSSRSGSTSCNNNVDAATEWLLAASNEAADAAAAARHDAGGEAETTGRAERGRASGTIEGESWELVGGHPESPLNVIAGVDHLNIHDTGMGGWVVMNGAFGVAEPLLFVGERSTWYGKLFAGRSREAVYDLLDTSSRPFVRMEKTFSLTSTSARVSMISQGDLPVGPVQAADPVGTHIGTITSEWDAIKRRLLLIDSTPNHAAGTIALESPSVLDDTFRIKLGDAVLGTVTRPRSGLLCCAQRLLALLLCFQPFRVLALTPMLLLERAAPDTAWAWR
jgi:hypothetical protein